MKRVSLYKLPVTLPQYAPVLRPVNRFIYLPFRKLSTTCDPEIKTATDDTSAYIQYEPLESGERTEQYGPGGYHPVSVGDHFHGRYRVVHKLGFGTYSTLWLARDDELDRYVAVKVSIADNKSNESNILRQLSSLNDDLGYRPPGMANTPLLLDEFTIKGPNGEHQCTVTPPASMSLSDAREASYYRPFQLPVARAIAAQLIQAVAFMHSRGIVHGDIHMGNILICLPKDIDTLSSEQLYTQYGPPEYEPIVRLNSRPLPKGVPTHNIVPVWLGKRSDRIFLSEANILLVDFGESFQPSMTTRNYLNIPMLLAPPEIYFESCTPFSFPADMWTLACTIYNILGGRSLFEGFAPPTDWMVKEHVTVLGQLPPEWWERWDKRLQWFHEDGTRKCESESELGKPWAPRFEKFVQQSRRNSDMDEIEEDEKAPLFAMLKGMLAYRPEERLTASQVMQSTWMVKWALPELERMKAADTTLLQE